MTTTRPAAVIVLAAGEGTRMRSATPKVLHRIGGRSLLGHAIVAARGLHPQRLAVVVRHERDLVAAHVAEVAPEAVIADQDEVKGTGRAAQCGLDALPGPVEGVVLVTYGDVPLLTTRTLQDLLTEHVAAAAAVSVITAEVDDPTGYGRILRGPDGSVTGIVEHKDATVQQQAIREINSGIYAFDGALLSQALTEVGTDNAQGEKYLTDVLAIAGARGMTVRAHLVEDLWQTEGVNDRVQLATLGAELNRRLVQSWMRSGVSVVDPASTWIDADVSIEPDTLVLPGSQLLGATSVAANAVIGPGSTVIDSQIGAGATVTSSHVTRAVVGSGARVGPFAYLAAKVTVPPGGRVAAFTQLGDCADAEQRSSGSGPTAGPSDAAQTGLR